MRDSSKTSGPGVAGSGVQTSAHIFGRACALRRRRRTQRCCMQALLTFLVMGRALGGAGGRSSPPGQGGAGGFAARAQPDDTEAFEREAYVTLVTTPAYALGAETLAKVSRN